MPPFSGRKRKQTVTWQVSLIASGQATAQLTDSLTFVVSLQYRVRADKLRFQVGNDGKAKVGTKLVINQVILQDKYERARF